MNKTVVKPDLSIIIPMYNSAKTLEATVKSLAAPTRLSREFIFVDDGSTDDSADLAQSLMRDLDLQALIVRLERNEGVSAARNKGAITAKGRYFWFFDADDLISFGAYRVIESLITTNADILLAGYLQVFSEWNYSIPTIESSSYTIKSYSAAHFLEMYLKGKIPTLITSILFKAEIGLDHGMRFQEQYSYGEDLDFMIRSLASASHISSCSAPLAIYVRWPQSGSAQKTRKWYDAPSAMISTFGWLKGAKLSEHQRKAILTLMLLKQIPQAYFHAYYASGLREEDSQMKKKYRHLLSENRRTIVISDTVTFFWGMRSALLLMSTRVFFAYGKLASWARWYLIPRLKKALAS